MNEDFRAEAEACLLRYGGDRYPEIIVSARGATLIDR